MGTLMVVQLFWPTDKLLPYDNVDGMALGKLSRAQAATKLSDAYASKPIEIYLGERDQPVGSVTLAEAGMTVDIAKRVSDWRYPWYVRLLPTSLFWAGISDSKDLQPVASKQTDEFVTNKLMAHCKVKPRNATLRADGNNLTVMPAASGGTCDPSKVEQEFKAVRLVLNKPASVRISMKVVAPAVTDAEAKASAAKLQERLKVGLPLVVEGQAITVPAAQVYQWLEFSPAEDTVEYAATVERAKAYMDKQVLPKVAIAASAATVTTKDFDEVSRVGGSEGRTLNAVGTIASVNEFLVGQVSNAVAVTQTVPPPINFIRTYSSTDEGLNALLKNFSTDHTGEFGISYAELSGDKRRASYQGDKQFVTASTYKLFVAYSVLKRVESGNMSWQETEPCFNKMIALSDNACAESLLETVGLKTVTSEINALGLKNSNFIKEGGPYTTANDLAIFLGTLEAGSMFSPLSRERLIGSMTAGIHRQGIPAGAGEFVQVANKVGFLNGLLHDAAIVYSPKGTYVLAVMSDGSTWGTIAELMRELEKIR